MHILWNVVFTVSSFTGMSQTIYSAAPEGIKGTEAQRLPYRGGNSDAPLSLFLFSELSVLPFNRPTVCQSVLVITSNNEAGNVTEGKREEV